jgi:transposase-like protein
MAAAMEPADLAMNCPSCQLAEVAPLDSHPNVVVAWYFCPSCRAEWSARIRDGRPESHTMLTAGDPDVS